MVPEVSPAVSTESAGKHRLHAAIPKKWNTGPGVFGTDPANQPRCKPEVAIADAVIALVSNVALKNADGQPRVEFKEEWFDIENDATPEGIKPNLQREQYKM